MVSDPVKMELEVTVGYLVRILGAKFTSSVRAVYIRNRPSHLSSSQNLIEIKS